MKRQLNTLQFKVYFNKLACRPLTWQPQLRRATTASKFDFEISTATLLITAGYKFKILPNTETFSTTSHMKVCNF